MRSLVVWLALALVVLLGCRTVDLIADLGSRARSPSQSPGAARPAAQAKPTLNPDADPEFVTSFQPRCGPGDNSASVVTGSIFQDGAPLPGQRVQASAGPGGEPISEEPAVSDDQGNYQVTFICDGQACNGAFWIWLVDENLDRVSPFVEFIFDDNCRSGTLDFEHR